MVRRPPDRAGMALILTLAAIVLAGGLALLLQARAVRLSKAEEAALLEERLRVAAAEAAREALWVLAADEDLQMDHLGEDWAAARETTRADGLSTWAIVEDAGRFFNWNNLAVSNRATRSARDILLDLMTFCGDFSPLERVAALTDYVDADTRGDYEAAFYRRADVPYAPPDRELWAPAEMLHVRGFSAGVFQHRTRASAGDLFGGDLAAATVLVPVPLETPLPVNVNTAGRDVLMGVAGLQQEAAVRAVLSLRQVQPFESLALLFMANPELAAALEGTLSVSSSYFRVRARAFAGGLSREVLAWVHREADGNVRILQWIEAGG